jgi:hypothetical protein
MILYKLPKVPMLLVLSWEKNNYKVEPKLKLKSHNKNKETRRKKDLIEE